MQKTTIHPQVKICGLTHVDEALACAELGADAIGCVFFPRSPRYVTEERARAIVEALPSHVWGVGVFVNDSFAEIIRRVEQCRLRAVQLHGQESSDLVLKLSSEGVTVIKALFINGVPPLSTADSYKVSGYLVECAGGRLPGGNAITWDWSRAAALSMVHPVILAGGLNPENVSSAIQLGLPDAVDVSSGVEAQPGSKDLGKVKRFLAEVRRSTMERELRKIFS